MDLDPTLYSPHNDAPARTPSPPRANAPLPAFDLPSAPRPSVSPSVSRVFQKKHTDAAPAMSKGLDLSVPPSPHRHDSLASASSSQDDARDTASARDNIQALVSAGQRALGTNSSSSTPPSLAMFMGGGAQRRTHRIGTGMTEQEKEETERLEREMAATRAKWGDKGAQGDADPPRGGLSLADLMKGGKGTASASPVAAKVAQRFHAEPERPSSAPAAAPAKSPVDAQPLVVEAKIVSRSPPAETEELAAPQKSASAPPPADAAANPSPPPPAASTPAPTAFTAEPETATLPRSKSFGLGAGASNTLTRLQSSGVVADRLKWTETLQQPDAGDAPPAQPSAPPSPEKRRSVLERWGRDEPNAGAPASPSRQRSFALEAGAGRDEVRKAPEDLFSVKGGEDKASSAVPAPAPTPSSPAKSSYSKPSWSAAPIGVKEPSRVFSPPPVDDDDEAASPPVRHTRGVALPGLGPSGSSAPKPAPSTSARPAPLAFPSEPSSPVRTRTQSSDLAPASPGRPSVRAAAQRWGQTAAQSAAEKSEALQALKASYGVKLGPTRGATMPASSASASLQERRSEVEAPAKSKSVEVPAHAPAPVPQQKEAEPARAPAAARTASPAPEVKPAPSLAPAPTAASRSSHGSDKPTTAPASTTRTLADDVVAALLAPRPVAHLPPGEVLSLDVFHLNSPSDDPHPIDHNHMLFESEVVGVVYRAAAPEGEGDEGILTRTWVWRGRDAQETARTEERIARLAEKTGTTPVEVQAGAEGAELAEAFAGQLTVCRGARDAFDHLAQRMFSVQSHDDAVFVEEADVTIRTLCSGYATVFSSLGEVYAWLGEGSTDLERHAACEFAESLADGRSVEVLAEGEETALFWHQLAADGAEYANAHYWRYRPHHPQTTSVVRFSPSSSDRFSLLPTPALSPDHVSLLDAGFAESWVVVPEKTLVEKKGDVELALEAAEKLAAKWEDRGFGARTPFHVLLTPSLLPRDLPFLSRSLDLSALNVGATPRKMRVYTAQEARDELF
ncbi:uncharacterized protein RHOBADRAFT_54796 [Rhodotorula graminis WP1]|uniref:Gelsolin-like domain-containing protein n=1 Tax=Rhodotorula graminis (strain WP1) TaxID=578459 RepID=A0A0P9IVC5_RHOGW|nr:uncharacterized protein RHOBADRAFT_54796 [Rhodotorula graminis WP1]KPV73594.1 hypothetical protein RHOBADRAFT_54796 [Rhodotorula graminis WP1]